MGFDSSICININLKDTETDELIKKQALGEDITEEERKKISDYTEYNGSKSPRRLPVCV